MSNQDALQPSEGQFPPFVVAPSHGETLAEHVEDVLVRVRETIAPVWPLKDYVAVNPYGGLSERRFLNARHFLRAFSDCELLMPLEYFAEQYQQGRFRLSDIEAAIEELREERFESAPTISARAIVKRLKQSARTTRGGQLDHPPGIAPNGSRRVRPLSEWYDRYSRSQWTRTICEEIAKHCAAHYDQGQASWPSPWKHLPLFQAWRSAVRHDRHMELLGLSDFRKFVAQLPHTPEAAIAYCMHLLRVPQRLWETLLLSEAFTLPGWTAWTKYQSESARQTGADDSDFAGLLAIRLAYDAALAQAFDFQVGWESDLDLGHQPSELPCESGGDDATLRYTLLRASEIGYRRRLLRSLSKRRKESGSMEEPAGLADTPSAWGHPAETDSERKVAQMVFCIDVRSERIRRHLESSSRQLETFGFAGFFGVPLEYVPLGEESGASHVPALLSPQFQVHEDLRPSSPCQESPELQRRAVIRKLRKAWKDFQTSAVSCFASVETTGLLYGPALLGRTHQRLGKAFEPRFDGVGKKDRERLGPTLHGLNRQGFTTSHQVDLAETILRGLGLTDNFARLVVFCGHASETENNPLRAGLDCGACGGHSGEPNARFAATLLNQRYVRHALAERGICIPADTHFAAALHNTTTDAIEFFDESEVPLSHAEDLVELTRIAAEASERTRHERLPSLSSNHVTDLLRRSRDWSETRPEWGLAGNATFIAAPRALTNGLKLDGRAFLHSYDYDCDPEHKVLEQIMTAPLIVAHWINMQYYASTVDNHHFGSGTKTIHNVVGRFGVYCGNDGDLKTGLPWESVHSGREYQHHPQRLLAVLAAPRAAIEEVIAKHPLVESLLSNGWLHLVAVEDHAFYSYASGRAWRPLHADAEQLC